MFYDNFERICGEKGTKPSIACTRAGLKPARATNWRATGALPKEPELYALANALGCSVQDFFADGVTTDTGEALGPYEWAMLEVFRELDALDQAELLVHARRMRDRAEEAMR